MENLGTITAGIANMPIQRVRGNAAVADMDRLAVEEPLEIRVELREGAVRVARSLSITMRTPGHDTELAAGFLFTEGLVGGAGDIAGIRPCGNGNILKVALADGVEVDLARLQRHFYTSSSCGVCGKASIEALRTQSAFSLAETARKIPASLLHELPARLRSAQGIFSETGGLHASALFSAEGELLTVREDVGRHNALDKVIGNALLAGRLPLRDTLLLVSGRASFELVQKAAMAGIAIFAAVGAPSTLALELARETGMTLVGFLRDGRFNIYAGESRIEFAKDISQ